MTKAVLSAMIRPLVEPRLPHWVEPLWFTSKEQALEFAPQAEIGWFDLNEKEPMIEIARAATGLKWMNSIYAGLDFMPLDLLAERGVVVTNGVGINAITIAEYVVMLMLAHAKGYREVVRAQDRHEWLLDSPGKRELAGERVLLLGMGAIGSLIKTRLEAFDMKVVPVRRSGADEARLIAFCIDDPALDARALEPIAEAFPQAALMVRAFDRRQVLALQDIQLAGVVREVYESAICMGVQAMETLGVPSTEIEEVERQYRENDRQRMALQIEHGTLLAAKDLMYRPGNSMRLLSRGDGEDA